jgi:hypothetical protein
MPNRAKPLAAAFGRDQDRHQRAAGHDHDGQAAAAQQADCDDRGHAAAGHQQQCRRAEQHQPGREQQPVAEADGQGWHGQLDRHRGGHQRAGDQPGAGIPGPCRGGIERHYREQQVEAGHRREAAGQDRPQGPDHAWGVRRESGARIGQDRLGHDRTFGPGDGADQATG